MYKAFLFVFCLAKKAFSVQLWKIYHQTLSPPKLPLSISMLSVSISNLKFKQPLFFQAKLFRKCRLCYTILKFYASAISFPHISFLPSPYSHFNSFPSSSPSPPLLRPPPPTAPRHLLW